MANPARVVAAWLRANERITSRDYARLTGMSQTAARAALDWLVRDGTLRRGVDTGRSAHYHV